MYIIHRTNDPPLRGPSERKTISAIILKQWHRGFQQLHSSDNYWLMRWDTSWPTSIQKLTRLYIKHTRVDMGFVMQWLHIVCHTIHLLASPLGTSRFAKCLNNAFNNKMGTHHSKMCTSSNIKCTNSPLNHPIHG